MAGGYGRRNAGDSDYRHRGKIGKRMVSAMTKITWTNETVNPWVGCKKCAAGCLHCYAEKMAWRLKCMGKPAYQEAVGADHKWTGNIVRQPGQLEKVLGWRNPRMIFWGSMTDIFNEKVPFEWIDEVMAVIALCPQHTFQILTKRIERAAEYYNLNPDKALYLCTEGRVGRQTEKIAREKLGVDTSKTNWDMFWDWPLPNLRLGWSCSTQDDIDRMTPIGLPIPAAVHFLSLEPMLENIELLKYLWLRQKCVGQKGCGFIGASYDFNNPKKDGTYRCPQCGKNHSYLITDSIDQVIIGCESGPNRRPCKLEWVEDLIGQCDDAGVQVFVKQIEINGKVSHNPKEWPKWAQRQEYPK